jgi:hypothetical protein
MPNVLFVRYIILFLITFGTIFNNQLKYISRFI